MKDLGDWLDPITYRYICRRILLNLDLVCSAGMPAMGPSRDGRGLGQSGGKNGDGEEIG